MLMRLARALIVAVCLALPIVVIVARQHTQAIIADHCRSLTSDNWFLSWWYGCANDAAGGGASGAGD